MKFVEFSISSNLNIFMIFVSLNVSIRSIVVLFLSHLKVLRLLLNILIFTFSFLRTRDRELKKYFSKFEARIENFWCSHKVRQEQVKNNFFEKFESWIEMKGKSRCLVTLMKSERSTMESKC